MNYKATMAYGYKKRNIYANSRGGERLVLILLCVYSAVIFMFNAQEENLRYIYLAYGLLVAFLAVKLLNAMELKISSELVILLGYLLLGFISISWAKNKNLAVSRSKGIALLLILCVLLYNYNKQRPVAETILISVIVGGIALSLYCFFDYGFSTLLNYFRSGERVFDSEINNVNAISNTLSLSLMATLVYAVFKKKLILLPVIVVEFLLILTFQSRTSLIAVIFGTLVLMIIWSSVNNNKRSSRFFVVLLILLVILILLSQLDDSTGVLYRFSRLFSFIRGEGEGGRANSLANRSSYIKYGFQEFESAPLFGVGIGNAGNILKAVYNKDTYLHNNFVEILASGGIIGFILYYGFYVYVLSKNIKALKSNSITVIASVCLISAELIAHIGIVTYYSKVTYLLFALWMCAPEYANRKKGDLAS